MFFKPAQLRYTNVLQTACQTLNLFGFILYEQCANNFSLYLHN